MLLKLYDRGPEGTVKDRYKESAENNSRTVVKIFHCKCCGIDLAGIWKYNCRKVNAEFKRENSTYSPISTYRLSEDLYYRCISEKGNDADYYNDRTFYGCNLRADLWNFRGNADIGYSHSDQYRMLDKNSVRKEYLDISPLFKKYCAEMKSFDDMVVCPVCGAPLIKDEDVYLTSNSKDAGPVFRLKLRGVQTVYIPSKVYSDVKIGEIFKYKSHNATKYRYVKKASESSAFLFYANDFDDAYRYFTSYRIDEVQSVVDEKYTSIVELCNLPSSEIYSQADVIKSDTEKLKKFIAQIVEIENSIYAVCERLRTLYKLQAENAYDVVASVKLHQRSFRVKLEELKEAYDEACKERPENQVRPNEFYVEFPKAPHAPSKGIYPVQPASPVYVSVNIFNKKKATAENERIKEKYEAELRVYDEQCKAVDEKYALELDAYKKATAEYDAAVAEIERERKRKYEARVRELEEEANIKRNKLKAEMGVAQQEYDDVIALGDSIVTPETAKQQIIEDEIAQAEEMLKKLYSVLNAMYGCGVIFAKYRNFVACSSFSEYLESGRCTKLDGSDGAYNIYENEVRMNRIVSQLSQVIESLEQIKQNQFVIYAAINETNRLLNVISASTDKMVKVLGDIKADTSSMNSYLKDIANNTAVSAYYSQVNAFYAKKNAELTNSLGFMMAYK